MHGRQTHTHTNTPDFSKVIHAPAHFILHYRHFVDGKCGSMSSPRTAMQLEHGSRSTGRPGAHGAVCANANVRAFPRMKMEKKKRRSFGFRGDAQHIYKCSAMCI